MTETSADKESGHEAGRGDFAILSSSCSRFRANLDGQGEIPLSLFLAGRLFARIFLTFLPSLYEALRALALGSPRRSYGQRT